MRGGARGPCDDQLRSRRDGAQPRGQGRSVTDADHQRPRLRRRGAPSPRAAARASLRRARGPRPARPQRSVLHVIEPFAGDGHPARGGRRAPRDASQAGARRRPWHCARHGRRLRLHHRPLGPPAVGHARRPAAFAYGGDENTSALLRTRGAAATWLVGFDVESGHIATRACGQCARARRSRWTASAPPRQRGGARPHRSRACPRAHGCAARCPRRASSPTRAPPAARGSWSRGPTPSRPGGGPMETTRTRRSSWRFAAASTEGSLRLRHAPRHRLAPHRPRGRGRVDHARLRAERRALSARGARCRSRELLLQATFSIRSCPRCPMVGAIDQGPPRSVDEKRTTRSARKETHEGRSKMIDLFQRGPSSASSPPSTSTSAREDVPELGLPAALREDSSRVDRRDEARRLAHRAHPLPRGPPEPPEARQVERRSDRRRDAQQRSWYRASRDPAPQQRYRPGARREGTTAPKTPHAILVSEEEHRGLASRRSSIRVKQIGEALYPRSRFVAKIDAIHGRPIARFTSKGRAIARDRSEMKTVFIILLLSDVRVRLPGSHWGMSVKPSRAAARPATR